MIRSIAPSSIGVTRARHAGAYAATDPHIYPLLAHACEDACLAWSRTRAYSVSDFLRSVWGLAARLPAKRYAINLCKDRYHFVVGFAASLVARQISLLPTCRADEPLRQLYHRYPDAYILTDHHEVPADLPSFIMA